MSGEKATSPCNKFQANIFNKSKCQNCFKSRELHLLNDHDLEQAKPIYAGWLCLAPEGTDFDNPMQRSRKWQRRFFILYEHGSLTFALDELRSTLPQGTVNLNQCSEISDAEPRTGQRNALCIATTEQEIFIRGDNKEIINGWSEQLVVYPRTNKQNQKKKRKVEPVATQEPCPAKMAATDPCFPSVAVDICGRWQEEQRGRAPAVTPMWPPGSQQTPTGNTSPYLSPVSSCDSLASDSFLSPVESLDLVANGNSDPITNNRLAQSDNTQTAAKNKIQTRDESLLGLEATEEEQTAVSRKGRSEARTSKHEKLQSCGDIATLTAPPPQRRAKSLDRRTSDTVMTPDLLNFKKGWMVKLDENEQWKKFWFVLSTDSLRYYKDSIAEEASDLEGEIDLTNCYNVSEFQVQRNYGFQIHTPKAVYTLSAMTAGIRRNWIQALMKNVHPANAPDVASLPGHLVPCISPPESLPKPDVTRDSPSADVSLATDPHPKHRSVMERRREGRYKTFDWTEFRPQKKKTTTIDSDLQIKGLCSSAELQNKGLCTLELGDVERRQRREERRKRYEGMLGFSLGWDAVTDKSEMGSVRALSPKSQQRVEEEIEECWKLVEKTVFRLETNVPPMFTEDKETEETETELVNYRNRVEDLKAELAESELRRLALEAQLSTAGYYQQQMDPPLSSEADFCPLYANEKPLLNGHTQTLTDKDTRELLQQQNSIGSETPSLTTPTIWLHDTEGNFKELGETVTTPLSSDALDIQKLFSQADGQNVELPLDVASTNHQNQHVPSSEIHIENCEYTPLILEKPANGDDITLSCCEENHTLDQAAYQTVVRRLSQEVELLSNQNEALNQRNQEMLNQLTEADREIERLKSELSSRYSEPCHLPEVEQMEQTRVDDVERELSLSNERLLEARGLITSLEENLRETEALLLLNVQTDTQEESEVAEEEDGYLLQCLEAAETTKLTINQSEQTCFGEIQSQSPELTKTDTLHLQTATDADTDIMRLNQELEKDMLQDGESNGGEEKIQEVIEGMGMRFRALGKLLEVIDKFDIGLRKEEESEEKWPTMANQLKWEQEFWKCLLDKLESNTLEFDEEKAIGGLVSEATERMISEKQMLLLGCGLLPDTDTSTDEVGDGLKDLDIIWNIDNGETETRKIDVDESTVFDFNDQPCEIKHFRAITETKISLLNLLASSVSTSAHDKLQLISDKISNFSFSEHPKSGYIQSAATEALYCAHISRLRSKYEKELKSTKQTLLNSTLICSNCVDLMEENRELREKLSKLEELQSSLLIEKINVCCQTEESDTQDTDTELQGEYESIAGEIVLENAQQAFETAEEMVESIEFDCKVEVKSQLANQEVVEEKTDPSSETKQVLVLRRRVEELEDQLIVMMTEMEEEHDGRMSSVQTQHEEEIEKLQLSCAHGLALMEEAHLKVLAEMQEQLVVMKEEHDGKMSSLQAQHEKDMEKVKVTCERGLALMEESHVKVVEELQRRHTQDIQRLLLDRDTLLEEESAATATAIQAIKNAHQLELEREVERRHSTGNTHLDDVYRQHSEELASFQRELQALSQQFSLKCLENSHLVQAVEAERKALCQCQQENQDLRTRNQELSGHLAAEITRLFSLAKQDALPLSQGMDVYEMEITLRVKESEVQCLKQEITSLKDELQSAQKDKRSATKKYKDVYTELSITRAKSEQEVDELRENLRLVHRALDQTSL